MLAFNVGPSRGPMMVRFLVGFEPAFPPSAKNPSDKTFLIHALGWVGLGEAWEKEFLEIQSNQQVYIRGYGRTHKVIIVQTKGRAI